MSLSQGSFERMRVTTVFASPGAGKTTEVKRRFLSAIESGLTPDQVLVIAASREAANTLRDDLALSLQQAVPGSLARTLSSFAYAVLRVKAIAAGEVPPELISGSEQDRILAEIINGRLAAGIGDAWPKQINAQVMQLNGFRAELRDLITACLEHGVNPDELSGLGRQHQKLEWTAAAELLEEYLQNLSAVEFESRYDTTMLLREAADWLSALAEWPKAIAEVKLVLVDDAQELTPASSYFLKSLAARGADLVLVGDPDASTLGFRAADPRAMSNLAQEIAQLHGVNVEEIFLQPQHAIRTPAISRVLSKISAQIDTARAGRQRKGLNPKQELVDEDTMGVEGHVFNQPQEEVAWLARRLRELHLYEGIGWNEMAVVARSRNQLEQLAVDLAHESVPVSVAGAQSALRDEFGSRILLRLADVLLHQRPIDARLAVELLSSPLCGLDSLGLRRLRRGLRREELLADGLRNSDELLVALFDAVGSVVTVKSQEGKKVDRFLKNYFAAAKIASDPNQSIEDLLWQIWDSSGLAKSWQELSRGIGEVALQANRNLDSVVSLFAAANRYAERNPGGDPRVFVDQQLALGLPEDTLALNDLQNRSVLLLTPSGLIGRRFRVVATPQLVEGVWPNLRPRSSLLGATLLDALMSGRIDDVKQLQRSELPDELRMLHKTVGSASERLLVSATNTEDNQISQFIGLMLGQIPETRTFNSSSLTLRGMAGALRRKLATTHDSAEQSYALGLARLAQAGIPGAHPDSWYGLLPISTIEPLADLENEEVTIRPSQLENFVKCPLHWFLNAHGGGDKTFSANLGSLVHKALELGAEVNEESLWKLVESKWHTLSFEADWLEQAGERKAKKMIGNMVQYLRKFEADGASVIGREVSFEFEIGKARVRGQVDRLELYPDGRVMIVDLKTGSKAFTAEEAREHAQLGLYQLAFENGAFDSANGNDEVIWPADFDPKTARLAGAKLLLVSGDKPTEREQGSIAEDSSAKQKFESIVAAATRGMAMTEQVFVAQVGSHCTNENEFGSCQIHLTRAVSYVG
ncbi:ATP-dependent helicase [Rhodoluna lacicola]|uniref:ATP-dependent helicase n=1 Tax=Rhodoluna lacicola TaxID=529884 RepID=UPI00222E5680|nr:ATP-dependent DNA helicase [Rhodoluna lacicola]BDS50107.1 DNA helicase [Rhodoluna lacicola]